jgi:hypothetical protein
VLEQSALLAADDARRRGQQGERAMQATERERAERALAASQRARAASERLGRPRPKAPPS